MRSSSRSSQGGLGVVEDQILAEAPNSLCPPCNEDVVDPPSSETAKSMERVEKAIFLSIFHCSIKNVDFPP